MAAIVSLGNQIIQGSVAGGVTNPLVCMKSDGTYYDYLYVEFQSDVSFLGTVSFFGSLSNFNTLFSVPIAAYSLVTGYKLGDTAHALITSAVAPSSIYVFPVAFRYFFPTYTATNSGTGNVYFTAFGI